MRSGEIKVKDYLKQIKINFILRNVNNKKSLIFKHFMLQFFLYNVGPKI